MSPKVTRQGTPDEEDKSGLERKSSLRLRSNSLRGSLRKHKTHEAPGSTEEENFKREWKITLAQEVRPTLIAATPGQGKGRECQRN